MPREIPQPTRLDQILHLGGLRRRNLDNLYAQELIKHGTEQEMRLLGMQRTETAESMLETYKEMLTDHPQLFYMPGIGTWTNDKLNRALIVAKFPSTLTEVTLDNVAIHPLARALTNDIRAARESGDHSPLERMYEHLLNVWEENRVRQATHAAKHPRRGLTPTETLLLDNEGSFVKTFAYEEVLETVSDRLKAHLPAGLRVAEGAIDKAAALRPILEFFKRYEAELAEYVAAESADPKNQEMREGMRERSKRITIKALQAAHKIK